MSATRDTVRRFTRVSDRQTSTTPARNRQVAFNESPTPTGSSRHQPGSATQKLPYLLQGAEGNLKWKDNEVAKNAAGVASIAFAATDILRHIVRCEGNISDRNLALIQEIVDFLPSTAIKTFHTRLGKLAKETTPSGGFYNSFLPEEERTQSPPVQRTISNPRKRSRLLEELEAEDDSDTEGTLFTEASIATPRKRSRLLEELEAEDDSDSEDTGPTKGITRAPSELPYIIQDWWTIDGKKTPAAVLYAADQALPLHSAEVAQVLGKFHETVIHQGGRNVTLAKSMGLLGIPANAVLRIDLCVPCISGKGAETALAATSNCIQLGRRSAARNLVFQAAKLYDDKGYHQPFYRMPNLFRLDGNPVYAKAENIRQRLTTNGVADFNAPDDKHEVPVYVYTIFPETNNDNTGASSQRATA